VIRLASLRPALFPFLCALLACDLGLSGGTADPTERSLSASRIGDHIASLADDSMLGRLAGSPQERLAAEYIRDAFVRFGLEPGTPDYFQTFPIIRGPTSGAALSAPPEVGTSRNVIAVIPGSGATAGQWVLLGAHYDHVGTDTVDGSVVVYNGADDNASGTATMLEVAQTVTEYLDGGAAGGNRRSIMFQAFGAEEAGLIGSTHFAASPTVAMDSIVAMINLDMVGRLRDNTLIIAGVRDADVWPPLFLELNRDNLVLVFDNSSLERSDQFPFYAAQRPAIHLFSGFHEDYHRPGDDVGDVNRGGAAKVGRFAMATLWRLATN